MRVGVQALGSSSLSASAMEGLALASQAGRAPRGVLGVQLTHLPPSPHRLMARMSPFHGEGHGSEPCGGATLRWCKGNTLGSQPRESGFDSPSEYRCGVDQRHGRLAVTQETQVRPLPPQPTPGGRASRHAVATRGTGVRVPPGRPRGRHPAVQDAGLPSQPRRFESARPHEDGGFGRPGVLAPRSFPPSPKRAKCQRLRTAGFHPARAGSTPAARSMPSSPARSPGLYPGQHGSTPCDGSTVL